MASAGVTKYGGVANQLRDDIRAGVYSVGSVLPSVAQLGETFGVSHMTAKQALRVLADEGVIATGQGARATVITTPTDEPRSAVDRISELDQRVRELEERTRRLELLHDNKPTSGAPS